MPVFSLLVPATGELTYLQPHTLLDPLVQQFAPDEKLIIRAQFPDHLVEVEQPADALGTASGYTVTLAYLSRKSQLRQLLPQQRRHLHQLVHLLKIHSLN